MTLPKTMTPEALNDLASLPVDVINEVSGGVVESANKSTVVQSAAEGFISTSALAEMLEFGDTASAISEATRCVVCGIIFGILIGRMYEKMSSRSVEIVQ